MDVELKKIDSRSELYEQLRRGQSGVMLGDDDEATNEYFLMSLGDCLIGICSQGHGIRPSVLQDSTARVAWVGYNTKLANVNISGCCINFIIQLNSVFIAILCRMQDGSVVVIHELGAVRISGSGALLWDVTTDVLIDFSDEGDLISLVTEEGVTKIDKESGKCINRS